MESKNVDIIVDNQKDRRGGRNSIWLLLLLLLCFVAPQKAFSQTFNPLISFSVESCTLDKALEKLFAEYELNVAFSKAELSKIRIEHYSCSYKSVEEVLTDLLRGTGYGFKRIGKQYVIRKLQTVVPEQNTNQPEPEKPPKETIVQKTDTIVNNTADTIRIVDSMLVIRSVMRYDTVVKVEVQTDTVYTVKYQGYEIKWPDFRNNGWFVAPWLELGSLKLDYQPNDGATVNVVSPISTYALGLEGGYKHHRFAAGLSIGYRSAKYSISFDQTLTEGDYYVNDTLDTYYVVHPAGDTVFHYILDSTYVPLTTTNYTCRDVNRLDYLSVGMFASLDFVKTEHFRAFVKAGAALDFLLSSSGSYYTGGEQPQTVITKAQTEPLKFAFYGGLGVAVKVGNHVELVSEVSYCRSVNSLYKTEIPFDLRMHQWNFRLGLTYYF